MMRKYAMLAGIVTLLLCATAAATPPVVAKRIVVKKGAHTIQLVGDDDKTLATYNVSIGPGGAGPKLREGDMTTPVGRYRVTMHQPSRFKIFLRLDYPNAGDRARFERLSKNGELPLG